MQIHKNGQPDTWGVYDNGKPWWRELKIDNDRLHGDQPAWFAMAEAQGFDSGIIHYRGRNPRKSHEYRTLAAWHNQTGAEVYAQDVWHVALFEASYGRKSRPTQKVDIHELATALSEIWQSGLVAGVHQAGSQRFGNPRTKRQYNALKALACAYHTDLRDYAEPFRKNMITIARRFREELLNFSIEIKDEKLYNALEKNWRVISRLQHENLSGGPYSTRLRRYQSEASACT